MAKTYAAGQSRVSTLAARLWTKRMDSCCRSTHWALGVKMLSWRTAAQDGEAASGWNEMQGVRTIEARRENGVAGQERPDRPQLK